MWIWIWLIGFIAVAAAIGFVVDRRRGSRGESRAEDLPGTTPHPRRMDYPSSGAGM